MNKEQIYKLCSPYTITSKERVFALCDLVENIVKDNIAGVIPVILKQEVI